MVLRECGGEINASARINFTIDNPAKPVQVPVFRIQVPMIDTLLLPRSLDIPLFHEMLHWFQLLRHPIRFFGESVEACHPFRYAYLSRCYCGNISEQFAWGGLDHQEMRTILGAPDYRVAAERRLFARQALLSADPGKGIPVGTEFLPSSTRFCEGDDLSENAYRMARHTVTNPVRMRFGHSGIQSIDISLCMVRRLFVSGLNLVRGYFGCEAIAHVKIPKRFRLAHLVATNCCNAIVDPLNQGHQITNWNLVSGEAAQ
jgi:hypothetical protein